MVGGKPVFMFVLGRACAGEHHFLKLVDDDSRRLSEHVLAGCAHTVWRTTTTRENLALGTLQRTLNSVRANLAGIVFRVIHVRILYLTGIDE
jgi:hypothetical protein